MNIYLAIITTVLVLTQIIRLIQNAKSINDYENSMKMQKEAKEKWDLMHKSLDEDISIRQEQKEQFEILYDLLLDIRNRL